MQAEIEKVKKRREERAIEKAQHEEEMVGQKFKISALKHIDTYTWSSIIVLHVCVNLFVDYCCLVHKIRKFFRQC